MRFRIIKCIDYAWISSIIEVFNLRDMLCIVKNFHWYPIIQLPWHYLQRNTCTFILDQFDIKSYVKSTKNSIPKNFPTSRHKETPTK